MQVKRNPAPKISQAGITMVEVILSLVIASAFLVLMAVWQRNASDDLKAKRSADYQMTFTQAASRYVAANRSNLVQAMRTNAASPFCSSFVQLSASPASYTCVVNLALLVSQNVLPASFSGTTNPYGQDLIAILKLANPATGTDTANGGNQDIEILVVAANGTAITQTGQLGLTAELLGGVGGYVAPAGSSGLCPSGKDVCGAGWSSTLSAFGACRKGVDAGCD